MGSRPYKGVAAGCAASVNIIASRHRKRRSRTMRLCYVVLVRGVATTTELTFRLARMPNNPGLRLVSGLIRSVPALASLWARTVFDKFVEWKTCGYFLLEALLCNLDTTGAIGRSDLSLAKMLNSVTQAFLQADLRNPAQQTLGPRNVRSPHLWIIYR